MSLSLPPTFLLSLPPSFLPASLALYLPLSLSSFPHSLPPSLLLPFLPILIPLLRPLFRVEAICVLNQQRVFEDLYNTRRDGPLYALCIDPCELKMYTYQKHKIWTYIPFNEARSVYTTGKNSGTLPLLLGLEVQLIIVYYILIYSRDIYFSSRCTTDNR